MTALRTAVVLALLALGLSAASAAPAAAQAVPAPDGELTPMGAIRAGDSHRFIPAWDGGLSAPVKGYEPGKPHPDPFVEDARWFTVGPADLERYRVRMSAGMQELLRRFPRFEVPLYPTRRTAAAPQRIYDATMENAKRARSTANGLVVVDARIGVPFPVPGNGAEAMWNHLLRWRGDTLVRADGVALPDPYGAIAFSLYREERLSSYALGAEGPYALHHRRTGVRPPEVAGGVLALSDAMDPIRHPREAWYRAPGQRRPVRAPDFSHDTPDPASGGIRTADMLDMFSGLLDRFEWRLVGRRSMYVPYNAYRLEAANVAPEDFLWAEHPNPAFLRYELHRVWVVEARLKPGYRHAFPRRTYYLDEDSWQILMADHYDRQGRLARYAEAHGVTYSQIPVFLPTVEIVYDLIGNRYMVSGLDNQETPPAFDRPLKAEDFAREALEVRERW